MKCLLVMISTIVLLSACQMRTEQDIRPLHVQEDAIITQTEANNAKEIILSMEEVVEVKGVTYEGEIYLSPRVKHFDRFRLREIQRAGHQSVKKRYPESTVHISTDQKIFMELEKLEQQLKNHSISKERLEKKLEELDEMMKG